MPALPSISPQMFNAFIALIAFYATIKAFAIYRRTRDWKFLVILGMIIIFATQSLIEFAGFKLFGFVEGLMRYIYFIPLLIFLVYDRLEAGRLKEKKEKEKVKGLFGRYVASTVVDKLMKEAEIKLGGVKEEVTILFTDVRDFTKLSEKLPPEKIVSLLNKHFDVLTEVVLKYEGTLDKYIGDSAMVVFNVPIKQEDHAFRAVMSAIEMQKEIKKLNKILKREKENEINIGIGIATGEAVVGNIGSYKFMDYTAIGDTVNTASRLNGAAGPGEIVMNEKTYKMVKNRIKDYDIDPDIIKVKGKEKALKVFRIKVI